MSISLSFEPIKNYQLCRLFTVKVLKAVRQMLAKVNKTHKKQMSFNPEANVSRLFWEN